MRQKWPPDLGATPAPPRERHGQHSEQHGAEEQHERTEWTSASARRYAASGRALSVVASLPPPAAGLVDLGHSHKASSGFVTWPLNRITRRRVRPRCLRRAEYNTPPFTENLFCFAPIGTRAAAGCGGLRWAAAGRGGLRRAAAGYGGLRRAAARTRKRTFLSADVIKPT